MRVRRAALLCIAASLAIGVPAAAEPAGMPTRALQRAQERGRSAGLERSEPLARALLHLAAAAPTERRLELLAAAGQADPTLAAPHLYAARIAAGKRDAASVCAELVAAVQAVRLDARQEALWLQRASRLAHTALTATLATLALLFLLRGVQLARHAFGERLGSYTAATLLGVVPVVAAAVVSPALAVLVLLVALLPMLRRRERTCLAVVAVALAGLEFALPRAAPHALLLDPRSECAHIDALNAGETAADLQAAVASPSRRSSAAELVLGLAARRNGDDAAAALYFVRSLQTDSSLAAAYLNLANVMYRAGDYGRAAAGYRAAQTADPAAPLPHANLAQTYIRMIHYGEADTEQQAAAARGMLAVQQRRTFWRDDDCPVLDQSLTRAEILALARAEARRDGAAAAVALQPWRSFLWRSLRPGAAPWLLLAVAVLLLVPWRFGAVTRACTNCGTMVCTHCASADGASALCTSCLLEERRSAPRPAADSSPEAADHPSPPPPKRRIALASGRWLAPLFPGGPDLARGDTAGATVTVLAAWVALLVAAGGLGASRPVDEPWYAAADHAALRLALVGFFLLWLLGLLRLRAQPPRRAFVPLRDAPGG